MKRSLSRPAAPATKRPRANTSTPVPRLPANIMGKIYAMVDPRTRARMHVLNRGTVANTLRTPSAQHAKSYLTGGGKHQKLFSTLPKKLLSAATNIQDPATPYAQRFYNSNATNARGDLGAVYLRLKFMIDLYKKNPGPFITRIPQPATIEGHQFSGGRPYLLDVAERSFLKYFKSKRIQLKWGPQVLILHGHALKRGDENYNAMAADPEISTNGKLRWVDKEKWMDVTLEWAASKLPRRSPRLALARRSPSKIAATRTAMKAYRREQAGGRQQ